MGYVRGWAWAWLVLALSSAVINALGQFGAVLTTPVPGFVIPLVLYSGIAVAVLAAQREFSRWRALAAFALALVFGRLLNYAIASGPRYLIMLQQPRWGFTAFAVFGVATIFSAITLRQSKGAVWAIVVAFVAVMIAPISVVVASRSLTDWQFVGQLSAVLGGTLLIDAAAPLACVWAGTLLSRTIPRRGQPALSSGEAG